MPRFQQRAVMENGEVWEGWRFKHLMVGAWFYISVPHISGGSVLILHVKISQRFAKTEYEWHHKSGKEIPFLRETPVQPCLGAALEDVSSVQSPHP